MKRVLVADDTKNIRTLVGKCLQAEGYEVAQAEDGQQALEQLRSQRYDLAFLDIKMPGMSGTEVLKTIRASGIDTPVIIITAYATVKNAVECTQMGAVAYLHKPFTADKLRNVLAEFKEHEGLTLAGQLIAGGRAQEALPMLKRALADRPLDAAVYLMLARASDKLGKQEDAVKYKRIYESLRQS
jgi:two-component system, OmpR family, response regulator